MSNFLKIVVGLLLLLHFPGRLAAQEDPFYDSYLADNENTMVNLINNERSRLNIHPLTANIKLKSVALAHNKKMASMGKLGHFFLGYPSLEERVQSAGLTFSIVGENVAAGDTFSAQAIADRLMSSPHHRDNILDKRYTHVGCSIFRHKDRFYITQEFATLFNPLSGERCENELRESIFELANGENHSLITYSPGMAGPARSLAMQWFFGNGSTCNPNQSGDYGIMLFCSQDLDLLKKALITSVPALKRFDFSLGVVFGSTLQYPGGAYAVALLIRQ